MVKKYFVVSDVHGFYSILINTLKSKGFDINNPNHILCVCGDLFDRGDEALELLEFVQSLPDDRFIYIKGNHEDLLFDLVEEIKNHSDISYHHYHNGTPNTLCQLCKIDPYSRRDNALDDLMIKRIDPVLNYIRNKAVDYVIIGNNILVHGWVPSLNPEINKWIINPDWKEPKSNNKKDIDHYNQIWKYARWYNGMEKWYLGARIPNYNIICGHYHCSYGWSHIRQKRKEFPQKNRKEFEESFEPFIDEGITAIDACTAYSGLMNCIVLEV